MGFDRTLERRAAGANAGADAPGGGPAQASHADDFTSACYDQLRRLAASYFARSPNGTLQPTLIVHEAYLKLAGAEASERAGGVAGSPWADREHFLAVAATAMRQVLADHARRRRAAKRSPGGSRVDIGIVFPEARGLGPVDVVELDDALAALASADPRAARVVELRFFGGLTVEQTAAALGVGRTTVEEDWRIARAWLRAQTSGERRRGHPAAHDRC